MTAKSRIGIWAMALLITAMAIPAFGQGAPDAGGAAGGAPGGAPAGGGRAGRGARGARGAGGPGGGGGMSRAQQIMNVQTALTSAGVSADDFTAMTPKITAVLDDIAVVQSGQGTLFPAPRAGGGGRGRGGAAPAGGAADAGGAPPAPPAPAGPNDVQAALTDLTTTLAAADSTADTIKAKVDAYRAAVKAATEKLATDRDALKTGLADKVQAALLDLGILS